MGSQIQILTMAAFLWDSWVGKGGVGVRLGLGFQKKKIQPPKVLVSGQTSGQWHHQRWISGTKYQSKLMVHIEWGLACQPSNPMHQPRKMSFPSGLAVQRNRITFAFAFCPRPPKAGCRVSHKPQGCGSKPIVPFGGRCTSILAYFSGDWDVHWGYDLAFDQWPNLRTPSWALDSMVDFPGGLSLLCQINAEPQTSFLEESPLWEPPLWGLCRFGGQCL